ncbi:hypothetical protein [Psychrobacter sp. FDAARGOS_221]|uniref:hypothetical protein n=1 Tax=Psychrobacter sp. FDAARGOS_221 TaxID=1975705 RepID=UPI000BB57695|nr:hypothetical protein [Psychrobacter sp. FDAARGOS_221]PNK61348.1 hypothetical protein A6J60_011040 [Psychrobacter sp. FDAARGOS_221]
MTLLETLNLPIYILIIILAIQLYISTIFFYSKNICPWCGLPFFIFGKYNVSTSALNENNGIVRGEGPNGELGNKPGVCAEPACAMVAGNNPSPATGSATLWCGKDGNPYTDKDADILDNQQMDPCLTCAEPNIQQIYQDTAIPKRQGPNLFKGEE